MSESMMDLFAKMIARDLIEGKEVDLKIGPAEVELEEEDDDEDDIPFCDGDCDECDLLGDDDEDEDEPLMFGVPDIIKVVFNPPATIVFWEDHTKTVVKCAEGQVFDRYAGFCAAVCKRLFGSTATAKELMESVDEDNWKLWLEQEKQRRRDEQLAVEQKAHEEKEKTKEVTMDQLIDAFVEALKKCTVGGEKE